MLDQWAASEMSSLEDRQALLSSTKFLGRHVKPRANPLTLVRNRSVREGHVSARSSIDYPDSPDRLGIWFDWDWVLDSERWDDCYSSTRLHPSWSPSASGSDTRSSTNRDMTLSTPEYTTLHTSDYHQSTSCLPSRADDSSFGSSTSSSGIFSILDRFPIPRVKGGETTEDIVSDLRLSKRSKMTTRLKVPSIRSLTCSKPLAVLRSICRGKRIQSRPNQVFSSSEMLPLHALSYDSYSDTDITSEDDKGSSVTSQTAERLWAVGDNATARLDEILSTFDDPYDQIFTGYTTLPSEASREVYRARNHIDTFHEAVGRLES